MSTHKYKLTVENLFSGEFASFDITDSGVKYCLENPEEFAGYDEAPINEVEDSKKEKGEEGIALEGIELANTV